MIRGSKPIEFRGSSLEDLRKFPDGARRAAGFQLQQIQEGREPDDWKPMQMIGTGCREVRIREKNGAYRVIYVAKFADAIYVLHCFQKKTQKTASGDLAVAARRYAELAKELGQ